ncbi:MAG: IS5 family transposase [Gammaproteobacteria bacterium]
MLNESPSDSTQTGFFDIAQQLDHQHPLLALGQALDWQQLEETFAPYYSPKGRGAKPIRLMSGLLMLKQLYNLSDETLVCQWQMNPYYQVFCGETSFQAEMPCHSTELVKFRQRIGEQGVKRIFGLSVLLHGQSSEENKVLVDTTVQEKAITYPTDSKLAIKIINRLNKLAKVHGIKQRRTFVKETKGLRLCCRHFRHVKRRGKARKALKRLRTIAGILLRELQRKLPVTTLEEETERFALYERVLSQKPKDKNKVYSLHEPGVYCVGKGKDHKPYEYGRKASVVTTLKSQVIVGVASHDEHEHDSKTLQTALTATEDFRGSTIEMAIVDRGYRGAKKRVTVEVLLPGAPLKRDTAEQRQAKRRLCQRRAAIEPVIGHLKQDYRLSRNWLKGSEGDAINLMMAACAWNLRKWMVAFFFFDFGDTNVALIAYKAADKPVQWAWVRFYEWHL